MVLVATCSSRSDHGESKADRPQLEPSSTGSQFHAAGSRFHGEQRGSRGGATKLVSRRRSKGGMAMLLARRRSRPSGEVPLLDFISTNIILPSNFETREPQYSGVLASFLTFSSCFSCPCILKFRLNITYHLV